MNDRGVFCLKDAIGLRNVQAGLPDGRIVRAIPLHFDSPRTRLSAAWEVIRGRAVAMKWPEPGDLEDALGEPHDR